MIQTCAADGTFAVACVAIGLAHMLEVTERHGVCVCVCVWGGGMLTLRTVRMSPKDP